MRLGKHLDQRGRRWFSGQVYETSRAHWPGKLPSRSVFTSAVLTALSAAIISRHDNNASAILVYDRNAAVAYANANYNKVVSDGYFYESSYPATFIGPGKPVPAGVTGDDCAHFVSSVLGTPAGGLTIPNRAGTYGEPGAARLDELLVGNSLGGYGTTYKYGVLVIIRQPINPRRCHWLRLGRQRQRRHEHHRSHCHLYRQ